MVACPACAYGNMDGADTCEQCQADLTTLASPIDREVGLGQRLLTESIMALQPADRVTVFAESTVADVMRTMCDRGVSGVLVMHRDSLVGIFTERDFLKKIAHRYGDLANEPIRRFMSPDPQCLDLQDSIAFGLHCMAVGGYRHLPILRDGEPVALARTRDVIGYIHRHIASA